VVDDGEVLQKLSVGATGEGYTDRLLARNPGILPIIDEVIEDTVLYDDSVREEGLGFNSGRYGSRGEDVKDDESIPERVPAVEIELRYVLGFRVESEVWNDVWSEDRSEVRCENRSDVGLSGTYIDVPRPSGGASNGDGENWSGGDSPRCPAETMLSGEPIRYGGSGGGGDDGSGGSGGSGGEVSWCWVSGLCSVSALGWSVSLAAWCCSLKRWISAGRATSRASAV